MTCFLWTCIKNTNYLYSPKSYIDICLSQLLLMSIAQSTYRQFIYQGN
ncbi:hypothetical protein DJ94_4971 [Bacillus pseudomycoides]|nr:hypothetical protein DJ94_4971 [Bacillus pseudomycoides]